MQADGIISAIRAISSGIRSVLRSSNAEVDGLRRSSVGLCAADFPLECDFGRAVGCDLPAKGDGIRSAAHVKADRCAHRYIRYDGSWSWNDWQVA